MKPFYLDILGICYVGISNVEGTQRLKSEVCICNLQHILVITLLLLKRIFCFYHLRTFSNKGRVVHQNYITIRSSVYESIQKNIQILSLDMDYPKWIQIRLYWIQMDVDC